MRHGASFIAALEGLSKPAFRIARELTLNSRSGLTVRFLSKKLELPEEEVEYLIDVNHKLFFSDLTKVKLVAEGHTAVKRISEGLENRGDIPSLFNLVKNLEAHEFRRLEEKIGVEKPGGKKAAAEALIEICYTHPESVMEYVASHDFSPLAQEVFDLLWQSGSGVMPVAAVRGAIGKSDYEVEQALLELFQGFALFEMFRFDSEDRLVRVAGLLSELRQWQEVSGGTQRGRSGIKVARSKPEDVDSRGLDFSERICRLVAAVAAKPARIRGDGELFREDRRRLAELCSEDEDPSLATCLWVAQGVNWIARVDNELRAADLEDLLGMNRLQRHEIVFNWLTSGGNEQASCRVLSSLLDDLKPDGWYPTLDFIEHALHAASDMEQPILRNAGGHWHYVSPVAAGNSERGLARSLEEAFLWLGIVDRAEEGGRSLFRVTELGRALLTRSGFERVAKKFPPKGAEIIVQPNFDIVVPTQDTDPLLTVPLDQFAERRSTGVASVYTMTKDSFTRAIQDGHDSDRFITFLLTHNRGGALPPNVMTTLDDWRGGMKRVRLRTIHVLESDDPLVMADLLHRRRFMKHFEQIDPRKTVAFTRISKTEIAKELEKEGFVVG
ncbi:MAG: helicase-associated domain-containing protein [Candidatus Hydrogenedentes bacterium]|nr:helicase-associated domain-containing protein [Candidatus Hydrogenedentota bacterium]